MSRVNNALANDTLKTMQTREQDGNPWSGMRLGYDVQIET